MDTKSQEYKITIKYNSDPTKMIDDHDSEPVYLTEINERRFKNIYEAIKFMTDCNSPITTISDLLPDVNTPKNFKLVLPEQNIKIKHQANSLMDSMFDLNSEEWG